jgi:carbonic anhydrase
MDSARLRRLAKFRVGGYGRAHMKSLDELFQNNREWAEKIRRQDPEFFAKLSRQQSPNYLWIGCADSRVPANQIVGLLPGDVFVHRNIANMVVHTDLNCLSVMQFAVDILKVKHVIVVGHYGCSGVQAAMRRMRVGLADNWLRHVQDVHEKHQHTLSGMTNETLAADRLCELNVIEQVQNVCHTSIARDAWERGQELNVHGWIYGIADGLARDLKTTVSDFREASSIYQAAVAKLADPNR